MEMTKMGFVRGLVIAVLALVAVGGTLYKFLGLDAAKKNEEKPAVLVAQAWDALKDVQERDLKTTLRPARYDAIMMPLDRMLQQARDRLDGDSYDPIGDYEYIHAHTEPILEIADAAYQQAMGETSFLKKEFRFMEQKGDACRYWATAMWNRIEAEHRRRQYESGRDDGAFVPEAADSEKLLGIIGTGIDAAPQNKFLWHLRALVERSSGMFAASRNSLERALERDPTFIAAWNDLGLTLITLHQFDRAEAALVKAMELSREAYDKAGMDPGQEYLVALMNLADFHSALATFYRREVRVNPGEENNELLRKHTAAAERYTREVLAIVPRDSPDARKFKQLLESTAETNSH